jgi:hypothetical protein
MGNENIRVARKKFHKTAAMRRPARLVVRELIVLAVHPANILNIAVGLEGLIRRVQLGISQQVEQRTFIWIKSLNTSCGRPRLGATAL